MRSILRDIRYAVRQLRHTPGFTRDMVAHPLRSFHRPYVRFEIGVTENHD